MKRGVKGCRPGGLEWRESNREGTAEEAPGSRKIGLGIGEGRAEIGHRGVEIPFAQKGKIRKKV